MYLAVSPQNHFFKDFMESTVAYSLDKPTVSLEHVFFPSVTLCNMNALRKSFIVSLMRDEHVKEITNYQQLHDLILETFISGGKDELSSEEAEIIDRK